MKKKVTINTIGGFGFEAIACTLIGKGVATIIPPVGIAKTVASMVVAGTIGGIAGPGLFEAGYDVTDTIQTVIENKIKERGVKVES